MADCFLTRQGGNNTKYGENIFDFNAFRTKLSALPQPVVNGTVTWLDNGFKLTVSTPFSANTFGVYVYLYVPAAIE